MKEILAGIKASTSIGELSPAVITLLCVLVVAVEFSGFIDPVRNSEKIDAIYPEGSVMANLPAIVVNPAVREQQATAFNTRND